MIHHSICSAPAVALRPVLDCFRAHTAFLVAEPSPGPYNPALPVFPSPSAHNVDRGRKQQQFLLR